MHSRKRQKLRIKGLLFIRKEYIAIKKGRFLKKAPFFVVKFMGVKL